MITMIKIHCVDDQDKSQSITDTGNEFTECQTPRKKLQSGSWHFICKLTRIYENFKSNISEAYKVQVDCLKVSESDSYDKNDMKEKMNGLVRLHEARQEKIENSIIFRTNLSSYLGT